jgi:AraC-like DNA-binding protein
LPEEVGPLPIPFYTVCDHYQQETMRRPNGASAFHQILLVLDGTGILKCKGKTYPLKRGCAFFTAKSMPADYYNTGGLITAFLTFNGAVVENIMQYYGIDGFLFYESSDIPQYLAQIHNLIREYDTARREGVLSAYTYSFVMDFFEEQKNTSIDLMDKIAGIIEKNYACKLTLAQLAGAEGISVSKLCHDFQKKYNCTVFQYILNLRLLHAQMLLVSQPEMLIKDVALACGFDDISYFCRAYKTRFGQNPSTARGG